VSVQLLDYRDSGMLGSADNQHPDSLYAAPLDDVARKIAATIRRVRPDVIITHDQYGWYGHPDHIKVYQATLCAYEMLYGVRFVDGQAPTTPSLSRMDRLPRLYVSTLPKWLVRWTSRLLPLVGRDPRRYGQNGDVDLVQIASWVVRSTARIKVDAYQGVRLQAVAAHVSQHALTDTQHPVMRVLVQYMEATEHFARVYPPVRPGEGVERELFAAEAAIPVAQPTPRLRPLTP
jgi:LmbE family N-acetylglucosaminyl deacetylase